MAHSIRRARPAELPVIAGDSDGVALGINDSGQVVGGSGNCASFNPNTLLNLQPVHALLWQKGAVTDLGNLGGKTGQAGGNLAWGINNRGQVVGVSDMPGDTTFHAFLWTEAAGMQDLGTLTGDVSSTASGLNDQGEVVGVSLDASFNARAFLWRGGVMADLNTLIPANSSLFLLSACHINSRREIAGLALRRGTGQIHAYLATPCDGNGSDSESCNDETQGTAAEAEQATERPSVVPPENGRKLLQQQSRFGRFGAPFLGPQ